MSDETRRRRLLGAVRFQRSFLLLMVAGISILFLWMIKGFILTVLLAGIFAGLSYPLYQWLLDRMKGRKTGAATIAVLALALGVGVPLAAFLAIVAAEAVQVSQAAAVWFQDQSGRFDNLVTLAQRIPFVGSMVPDAAELVERAKTIASEAGPAAVGTLAAATRGTLSFMLQLFILLYSLFFFLRDGQSILRTILYYVPLTPDEEAQLLERFVSVSRATLKGSLLIGVIQGGLAGVSFWVAGVPGSVFWGAVMIVLSIIPAIGAAFVWIPAVIYLFLAGNTVPAIGLFVWCAVVVSSVDNFLRPMLIGRDARMSDLLILLSTLGGIVLFGAVGFIVGPIVAALFVTIWHIYGQTFRSWLPEVPEGFLTQNLKIRPASEPEPEGAGE